MRTTEESEITTKGINAPGEDARPRRTTGIMGFETKADFGGFENYETWAFHVMMTYDSSEAMSGFRVAAEQVRREVERDWNSQWVWMELTAEQVLPIAFGRRLQEMNAQAFEFKAAEPIREASGLVDWTAVAAAILDAPEYAGKTPLFMLGRQVVTLGVRLEISPLEASVSLIRHIYGDWGELPEQDREENERSLHEGGRLFSRYRAKFGTFIYIVTEHDRSATTLLLAREY